LRYRRYKRSRTGASCSTTARSRPSFRGRRSRRSR
jgi:hypothetical protein